MKKCLLTTAVLLIALLQRTEAQDPITMVIKEGIKKVIVAVDLKIQRLQTKTIWLQNVQNVIENTMSKLKLGQITEWVQKQKDLYKNYFDELWKVKDAIAVYHRIKEITRQQIEIVKAYHTGWNAVVKDNHFNGSEVTYIGEVYTGIVDASLKNLEQLSLIIKSFATQMNDEKRMEIINSTADAVQKNLDDIRSFNEKNLILSIQRSKEKNDIDGLKKMYGLN